MALKNFKYVATDQTNQQTMGSFRAETRDQVAEYLRGKGLFVVSVTQDLGLDWKSLSQVQIGGISLKEKMLLVKQFSTMLSAGLPVVQAVDILGKQSENKNLEDQLRQVQADIEGGMSLSKAFQKNTKLFNDVQINLLAAGEKSGNMVTVIAQIAKDLEKSNDLNSKIRSAMIYPAIIFIAIIIVLIILVVFMIPTVESLYKDFNAEDKIPDLTKFVISASKFLTDPVGLISIILILGIIIFSFNSFKKTERGHYLVDKLKLRLPVFGQLLQKMELAQFGRLLAMLLVSGVSIIDALTIVSRALNNTVYQKSVAETIDKVAKGVPLAVPLAATGVFPLIYTRMISTGEQTGNLDKVLGDMGAYYEAEVNDTTNNLTKLMEPLILLVVGAMVGFLAVVIYLPLYNIGNVIAA